MTVPRLPHPPHDPNQKRAKVPNMGSIYHPLKREFKWRVPKKDRSVWRKQLSDQDIENKEDQQKANDDRRVNQDGLNLFHRISAGDSIKPTLLTADPAHP